VVRKPLENSVRIVDQRKLIHTVPWDTLILLDACRYDAFTQIYGEYLTGDLIKAYSHPCTKEDNRLRHVPFLDKAKIKL
jgi:hypothetical protein